MIIHLNGWPGVGKLTIGRLLATDLGARLIHNHLLHDVAIGCTSINDPARWPLYEAVRSAAYQTLAERPANETFVMTNALCAGAPREREAWNHVVDLAIARNVPLIPIVLVADIEENARRVQQADRIGRKLADSQVLKQAMATDCIQEPDVAELLVLDVTRLEPDAAAAAIRQHLTTLDASGLEPAGIGHRQFRNEHLTSLN